MNFPESQKPAAPVESPDRKALIELRKSHSNLRVMFHLLALCSLMLTGILFVIIFKQVSLLRRDMESMSASVSEYEKVFVPQLDAVRVNLETFAKTNESLTPILRRYFGTNAPKGSAVIGDTNKP